jgi:hypothetical protein
VRIGIALPIDLARQASRNEVANWLRSRLRFDRKLPRRSDGSIPVLPCRKFGFDAHIPLFILTNRRNTVRALFDAHVKRNRYNSGRYPSLLEALALIGLAIFFRSP